MGDRIPKVLFVDDESSLLDAFRTTLRREPYETLTTSSPKIAREMLSRWPVDVIVSDECMPEGSGVDLLAQVAHEHPGTMRILLTGRLTLASTLRAVNTSGVFRILIKPIAPLELASAIRDALRCAHVEVATEQSPDANVCLKDLERSHPGITHVERDPWGAVVIRLKTKGDRP